MKRAFWLAGLALILALTLSPTLARASSSGRAGSTSSGDFDSWDDDVWADWGAQPTTKGGAPQNPEKLAAEGDGATDDLAPPSAAQTAVTYGGGLGDNKNPVKFILVRDSLNEGPKGVRKHRPTYGKRRSL